MYEHQRRPPVDPWMYTFRKFPRKLRLMFACVLPCVSVRPRASISVLAMSGSAEEHMGTSLPARCKRKAAPVFDVWEYFDKAEADGTVASEFNEITKQRVSFGRRIARLHSGSPAPARRKVHQRISLRYFWYRCVFYRSSSPHAK